MRYLFIMMMGVVGLTLHNYTFPHIILPSKVMAICHPTQQQIAEFETAKKISKRFKVSNQLTAQVVKYTHKYERDTFPKAEDLIAIIGVESSFKPKAVSALAKDPAIGLTQIRPAVWRNKYTRVSLEEPENQVKYGAEILSHYFDVLGSRESAVQAYNVGITAFKRGKKNPRYVAKYKRELAQY